MSMEDILKALVDSRQRGSAPQQNHDPMAELIGGLLGGGQQAAPGNSQAGGLRDMMGLLETVMGNQGGTASQAGSVNSPIMALLQPFVAPLAKKANIPPEIAMIVITFVVHKLLSHHPTSGRDSNSFDLDELLGQVNTGQVSSGLLQSSGMVKELSNKTGLDESATEQALMLAFSLVGKTITSMANKKAGNPAEKKSAGGAAKVKAAGARSSGLKRKS